ncbi:Na/Pi cotransporter family protein [Irregularibacter muris]|uniref:Na/Pi cotransporter family protein n=1 Tax=Irregularibacter muris TaxID=1796619 RepID=A0AAE3HDX0_9FIRM|nr:Na/Pi cotransporter family protein [Irregularibacter muris]MCR1897609.1 Na/Pi cotransporter family protein [Irregularibacter muris]
MTMEMLISLFGGLGLFIYGMNMMSDGLKTIAGDRMKRLLEILTNNRFLGILVGTVVTMIVQSSSTTTVMVVGFVNAGLMNLLQAIGVIMGANIGTTITAQMVALQVTKLAPIAITIGAGMFLFAKKKKTKHIGSVILGFGILFTGIDFMSNAMKPLRDHEGFKAMLVSFSSNPILGVLAGFALTAIIQSSSASIGLLQALAISGAFSNIPGVSPLDLVVPILLGENIGTCVTAVLSSIGASINAKRTAFVHFTMKVIGTLWFLILLGLTSLIFKGANPIYDFIISISGTTMLEGQMVPNVSREIANTHTLFNILNTIVLFPFAPALASLAERVMPGKEEEDKGGLKFLDERILENPAIAAGQAVKETVRMGQFAIENLGNALKAFYDKDEVLVEKVFAKEKVINQLEKDITQYLVALSNANLSEVDDTRITNLYHTINDVERIGDHSENLVELAQYRIENNVNLSDIAIGELMEMADKVNSIVQDAISALDRDDIELAETINKQEEEIDQLEEILRARHIKRLNEQSCHPSSGVIFLDMLSNLERIADHATNISKSVLDLGEF